MSALQPALQRHHPGQFRLRLRGSSFRINVPNELWGAASLALKLCATNGNHISRAAKAVVTQVRLL